MVYKVAIVGLGSQSGSWVRSIKNHPDFKISAVIDVDTELLENVPKLVPGLSEDDAFMSIDDMVSMGSKPDLAIVITPIYTHHVLVQEIMDHGINVICEKNMASNIYQGRQMVQKAIDNPHLSTAIGTQYRYYTKWWTARRFFREQGQSTIGDLAFIRWASAGNWGEKRRGWRRFLPDVYLEDMCTHWFDLLRYVTGMDVVQVKCDTFIPRYSKWNGSSTCFVNLALAHKDDYKHRHNWVWAQIYGDWQKRGPGVDDFQFFCSKGEAKLTGAWGLETKIYLDEEGYKWEEDGYLPQADVMHLGTNYDGQGIILEMTKRSIESKGRYQPETNFKEAFKSFAISMAAVESSRTGQSVWVPKYWEDLNID
jgi:predicted dehydrogenase